MNRVPLLLWGSHVAYRQACVKTDSHIYLLETACVLAMSGTAQLLQFAGSSSSNSSLLAVQDVHFASADSHMRA